MFVAQEGESTTQQHDATEHVPLNFEIGVGAVIEEIAHERIARADEADKQHQIFANSTRKEKKDKKPVEISRGDKIRDAISGLLAIIQLIEIQLPKRKKK